MHVRRRALLAFQRLSRYSPGILQGITSKLQKRLTDSDPVVVSAALTACSESNKAGLISADKYHALLSRLLVSEWRNHPDPAKNPLLLKIINALHIISLSQDDLKLISRIITSSSERGRHAYAALYQCFLALANTSPELLSAVQESRGRKFVEGIRGLLTSNEPNDIYLFVACLECLDSQLWAGTDSDVPVVLEEWEMERVMKLLDSDDRCIRQKTLRILQRIETAIVEGYYSRILQGDLQLSHMHNTDETCKRLLEIIEVISSGDSELYVQHVKNILQAVEGDTAMELRHVLQDTVEELLVYIRDADISFRSGCIGSLFASVIAQDSQIGPTMMIVLVALVTEFLSLSPTSPMNLLVGISRRLSSYSVSIQDACLLCMIRLAAECDDVPTEVIDTVRKLLERSGRYIRRRCDQFINLSLHKRALRDIVSSARSTSLPDFLAALEAQAPSVTSSSNRSPSLHTAQSPERSVSRTSNPTQKLRYEAYEPPKPAPRLRRYSSSSSRASDDGSSKFVGESQDGLARTITPGDLALASRRDLKTMSTGSPAPANSLPVVQILDEDDSATRVDLIALDSPFVSEPMQPISAVLEASEPDFETVWNRLADHNARGWCEASIDAVVRRLQGVQRRLKVISEDQDPFKGELKILVLPSVAQDSRVAVLRLKASDDDSCLWRLRCQDDSLLKMIRGMLAESY